MASLETILKFAVPAAATICLIFQAFQHFRKKKKTSEQTIADKNANKSDVEVEEEASSVSKGDGENVVKTETEDGVNTYNAKVDGENVAKTEEGVNTHNAKIDGENVVKTEDGVNTHNAKIDGENVVKTEDGVNTHNAKLDGENVVKTETEDGVNTHNAKIDGENVVKTEDGVNTHNAKIDGENVVKTEDGVNTHNAKIDGENVAKTEMEDGVNINDAIHCEMVQNRPGDKHRTNTSSGDGGSMLGSGDVSKTGTDHAKQVEMVQKSTDGKHRANPDNFSMGDLHSDNTEVLIKPGECSGDSQLVKSMCTSLSDKSDTQSLYETAELDLESVRQDDIENGNKSNNSATDGIAQLDSDSAFVSMESNVPHVTMVPNRAVS